MSATEITTQLPIVYGPTSLDEARTRFAEVASIVGTHAKAGAAVAGRAWWEIAKTSPQGLTQTTVKTVAWVKAERGAERVQSHYGALASLKEQSNPKAIAKQAARCEKFEKRHRRRVARRAATIAVPNLALVGANAYGHAVLPGASEALIGLAELGIATTVYGVLGNTGAVETIRQVLPRTNIGPEQLRKALRDIGITALRRDLEKEKPDTRIADFEADKARGTRTTTVELPSGVDVQEVLPRRRRLAASLRKSESQIVLAEGSAAHELVVTIYKSDPSDRIVESWPLASTFINIFDPIPLGVDSTGEVVTYTFGESHLFVAGQSGAGKSVTLRTLAASAVLDPRVNIWVWNGVQAPTFAFLKDVAEVYVNGNAASDEAIVQYGGRIVDLLNDACGKRGEILERLGVDKVDNDNAHVEGLNPIVVFMDELAPLFANRRGGDILREAKKLANQCRKYGIFLVGATQTFEGDAVPWSFVSLFQKKIGHRLAKASDNQALFGDDYAARGINACKIRTKGEAVLDGEDHLYRTLRVYMTDDQTRAAAAERGLKARGGEVARIELDAQSATEVATHDHALLRAILDVETAEDGGKLQCREIVERLPEVEDFAMFWFDRSTADAAERTQQRNIAANALADALRNLVDKSYVRDVSKPSFGPTAKGIYTNEIHGYLNGRIQ